MINRISRELWPALAVAASLAAAGCGPSSQASAVAADSGFVKVVNVEVMSLGKADFTAYLRLTGEVEAMSDVIVSAQETGVIERFFLEKGEFVRRGTPIAKIDDRILKAQVAEAEAAANLAKWRYERQRQLWEEEQIGSELAYQEAKHQAALQAARLENLQTRLERTKPIAPISGVFDERYVDAGEMVSPGTPVGRIVEVNRLKVTGGVPERFAAAVSPGDSARISFTVLGGREFTGVIGYVGSTVDTRNRTFPIEIVIENPRRVIKPQMVANVEIATHRFADALAIPQSAVERVENGYQVFVVVEDEEGNFRAEARLVKLGPSYANRIVVEDGLRAGDRLIVRGHQLVEAGDQVRIVTPSSVESDAS